MGLVGKNDRRSFFPTRPIPSSPRPFHLIFHPQPISWIHQRLPRRFITRPRPATRDTLRHRKAPRYRHPSVQPRRSTGLPQPIIATTVIPPRGFRPPPTQLARSLNPTPLAPAISPLQRVRSSTIQTLSLFVGVLLYPKAPLRTSLTLFSSTTNAPPTISPPSTAAPCQWRYVTQIRPVAVHPGSN